MGEEEDQGSEQVCVGVYLADQASQLLSSGSIRPCLSLPQMRVEGPDLPKAPLLCSLWGALSGRLCRFKAWPPEEHVRASVALGRAWSWGTPVRMEEAQAHPESASLLACKLYKAHSVHIPLHSETFTGPSAGLSPRSLLG